MLPPGLLVVLSLAGGRPAKALPAKQIDNRTREVAPMEFRPLTTDNAPSFGRGRGKSAETLEAERMLLACSEAQEKGGKNADGSLKVPGILLTDVGVTRTPEVDDQGNPVVDEETGEQVIRETFDEGYYKRFFAGLKTAAENLGVTVLRREQAPHDIAISVTERQAGPSKNGSKAQGAAKKATSAAKK